MAGIVSKAAERAILGFIAAQTGVAQGNTDFWSFQRELLQKIGNTRGVLFTDKGGVSYVIQHVALECYVVMGVNSETKISIPLTRQLQEAVDTAVEQANRRSAILICYDFNDPKLRTVIEETVCPHLQSRLRGVTSVVTEYSDTELAVEMGEPSELLAERQLEGAVGVIMCITSGYLASSRFPYQLQMFRSLGGKVFPVVYEDGLTLPPALALLEHDDGFSFERLDATIRRWLS